MLHRGPARWAVVFALVLVASQAQIVLEDEPGAGLEDGDGGGDAAGAAERKEATDPMTRMLQWGMENSNLEEMARKAQLVREGKMAPQPVDREAMEYLFGDKAKFLEMCVARVRDAEKAGEEGELVASLEDLEEQVTDIDNAGDLDHWGGVDLIIRLLGHRLPKVQQAALWVLGTTVQSHPKMQELVLSRGALPKLLDPLRRAAKSLKGQDPRLLAKNLYALSSLLRSCVPCMEGFGKLKGPEVVAQLLATAAGEERTDGGWTAVKRKVVALVGDLVEEEGAEGVAGELLDRLTEGGGKGAVGRMVVLLRDGDAELQEKAMASMDAIVAARPQAAAAMGEGAAAEVGDLKRRAMEMSRAGDSEGRSYDHLIVLSARLQDRIENATRGKRG